MTMTPEQADELLANNDWAKWSDARELLLQAAHIGAMQERERLLSMPNLMHACDALGAPTDGEHCDLLRRTLYRA